MEDLGFTYFTSPDSSQKIDGNEKDLVNFFNKESRQRERFSNLRMTRNKIYIMFLFLKKLFIVFNYI